MPQNATHAAPFLRGWKRSCANRFFRTPAVKAVGAEPILFANVLIAALTPRNVRKAVRRPEASPVGLFFFSVGVDTGGHNEQRIFGPDGRGIGQSRWIRHQRSNVSGPNCAGRDLGARLHPRGRRFLSMARSSGASVRSGL